MKVAAESGLANDAGRVVTRALRTRMKMGALLDKMGERLVFERTCAGYYQALIGKFEREGSWPGGPTLMRLTEFYEDELRHHELLRETILDRGGDPWIPTPSAQLSGIACSGIISVLTDPASNFVQCLNAVLLAELADAAGWEMLVRLSEHLGLTHLSACFRMALLEEKKQSDQLRLWVFDHVLSDGPRGTPVGAC